MAFFAYQLIRWPLCNSENEKFATKYESFEFEWNNEYYGAHSICIRRNKEPNVWIVCKCKYVIRFLLWNQVELKFIADFNLDVWCGGAAVEIQYAFEFETIRWQEQCARKAQTPNE